ncbi:Gfo/Idh/MocA family protein [Sphingorhabdus sp.]|uniref:Gfo/Idh/MocA family protein n=1 Tax=Sphingorhabdus sp. TaxID=1902408 RepID=UPI00391D52F8
MDLQEKFSRFLVVSLGSIGKRHARNIRAMFPKSEIAALRLTSRGSIGQSEHCDIELHDMDAVKRFAPQVAIVASPASTHFEVASALIASGVPTFIEKPLCCNLNDARQLVHQSAQADVTLMVGYNLRFLPAFESIQKLLGENVVGRVISVQAEVGQYLPTWRPGQDYRLGVSANRSLGGGALLELSHELDYLYWLFGMPDNVYAAAGTYSDLDIDVEDLVEIVMTYNSPRRIVTIHLDFVQQVATRKCKFVGTHGTLSWDGVAGTVMIDGHDSQAEGLRETQPPFDTYVAELRHFLDCIQSGADPLISAVDGYNVMAIIEAARRSAESGCAVKPEAFSHD